MDSARSLAINQKAGTMLQQLITMYSAAMAFGTTALIPHLVGPSGTGKSTVVRQLAQAFNVHLRVINVSRLNPLEVEGAQIPTGSDDSTRLRALLSPMWDGLRDGDIVFLDEFLGRGFAEVYNALLDIITSREVGTHRLPKVFFVAGSNSIVPYDLALEDRLTHIQVPDIRSNAEVLKAEFQTFVDATGMHPGTVNSIELADMFRTYVFPTYTMLDTFNKKAGTSAQGTKTGFSTRHLIAATQMRAFTTRRDLYALTELVEENNALALREQLYQFALMYPGSSIHRSSAYLEFLNDISDTQLAGLSEVSQRNVRLAQQLIQLEGVGA